MAAHYRKDSPNGITPPNPDAARDVIQHITKHRGMKTPYTSVSPDAAPLRRFDGVLYETDSTLVVDDGHSFIDNPSLMATLQAAKNGATRQERILADRALMLARRVKEALVDWHFDTSAVARKDRINWCAGKIQPYFNKV